MTRPAETPGDSRAAVRRRPAGDVVRRPLAALLALVVGLLAVGLGAAPARAQSAGTALRVAPGGAAVLPAVAAAPEGVEWELVGEPDASLVRSAHVDATTGELAVEVAGGYRGRVVLARRVVDRTTGTAGAPERVVVEVADDEPLAPGERLRAPLSADGTASVEVPLPAPAGGAAYEVHAGPGLLADVDPATGLLRVEAEPGVAGASRVVVVPVGADGTVAGEPLEVPVDVAPSLAALSGTGRADASVALPLPDVVGGSAGDLALQAGPRGVADVRDGALVVDPEGASGLLSLALVPSAGGVVGDPAPVTVDVAPVVVAPEAAAVPGERVPVPLEVLGTGAVPVLLDDAGGSLELDGPALAAAVPSGAQDDLHGSVAVVDADGLRSEAVPVVVRGTARAPDPASAPDAAEEGAPAPAPVAAQEPAAAAVAAAGTTAPAEDSAPVDVVALAAAAQQAQEEEAAALAASGETTSTTSSRAARSAAVTTSTAVDAPAGDQVAPGLVVLDTFSTAATTDAVAAPVTTTATAVPITALPRTGGELALGGALGGLVLLAGLALLVGARRRLLVATG